MQNIEARVSEIVCYELVYIIKGTAIRITSEAVLLVHRQ